MRVRWTGCETQAQRLNLTVEILVNAAGVCRRGRVESCADQDLSAQLLLNVVGTSRLTRLFAQGIYVLYEFFFVFCFVFSVYPVSIRYQANKAAKGCAPSAPF